MVTDGLGEPCERLPLPLDACPTCGAGVKQVRSFQWISPTLVFENPKIRPCASSSDRPSKSQSYLHKHCHRCVVCTPNLLEADAEPKDQLGLLWIGEKFYPSADDWAKEAAKMGVSKRISAIPDGFVAGKTWIFVAHPKALVTETEVPPGPGELLGRKEVRYTPGIFHAFVPKRIELVVTRSMKEEAWVKEMVEKNGVKLVEVPEDDPDHAPSMGKKSARKESMERAARKMSKKPKKKKGGAKDEEEAA